MKYHFKVHKEGKGFWAECIEIPGCVTQGDSKEELVNNMQDAVNTCLEEPEGSNFLASLPQENIKISKSIVDVSVDPEIAFAFMVRYCRIQEGLTQKEAAKRLGMKNLFSYQRLERKCNATLEMIAKVVNLFPKLSLDLVFE
jgi:predicted RNase H-like HicB family nuclease/DNA-binding XRE family transcriptional regulator